MGGGSSKVYVVQAGVIYIPVNMNVDKSGVPGLSVHVNDVIIDHTVIPDNSQGVEEVGVGDAPFLGFGHCGVIVGYESEGQGSSVVDFYPRFSLKDDYHMSVFEMVVDVTKNVFPPGTDFEMSGYSLFNFVGSL